MSKFSFHIPADTRSWSLQEKKTTAVIRNMGFRQWKAVANAIFDHVELKEQKEELWAALKQNVSAKIQGILPFSLSIKGLCSRSVTLFQQLSSSVRNSDFFFLFGAQVSLVRLVK